METLVWDMEMVTRGSVHFLFYTTQLWRPINKGVQEVLSSISGGNKLAFNKCYWHISAWFLPHFGILFTLVRLDRIICNN